MSTISTKSKTPTKSPSPSVVGSTVSVASDDGSVWSGSSGKGRGRKKGRRVKNGKVKIRSRDADELEYRTTVGQVAEDEYIVEKVLGKKSIETAEGVRKMHYYIKWKGWAHMHNTWEPIENLEGCMNLVERFETGRNDEDEDDDGENEKVYDDNMKGEVEEVEEDVPSDVDMTENKENVKDVPDMGLGLGILYKWPNHLIPLQMVGAVTVDKELYYIVKIQADKESEELTRENCVIIKGSVFRLLFHHIVIDYYEKNLIWVNRDEEGMKSIADKALEALKLYTEQDSIKMEPEDDVELDDTGLPIENIKVKTDEDLFGLPKSGMHSSSSSEDEFEPEAEFLSNSQNQAQNEEDEGIED